MANGTHDCRIHKRGVIKVKNSDHINKMKGDGASFSQKKMIRLFLTLFLVTIIGGCAVTNEPE